MAEPYITPNLKVMSYLSNWDEVNNIGTTTKPYITVKGPGSWGSGINTVNKSRYDGSSGTYRGTIEDIFDNLGLKIGSQRPTGWGSSGTFENATEIDDLQVISEGCYNKEQLEVSYENPIAFHYTKTYQNTLDEDRVIKGIIVYSHTHDIYDSNTVIKLICQDLTDDPITLHPGDKVTFTYIIK